jgi:hypothetical protein
MPAVSFFLLLVIAMAAAVPEPARAGCTKADFELVVDEAASALRELNAANKPAFQEKLRALKAKRGWDHDQFLREAAPLAQDERIAEFDQQSADYLEKINSLGTEGAHARMPDCAQLTVVWAYMQALVEAQKAKWAHMFARIGAELGR